MANPIVHFEIMGTEDQKERLQAFYRDTFDWVIEPVSDMNYGMVMKPEGEPGPGGAVDASPTGAGVVIYLGVDDIRAALAKAQANGAEVVVDVTTVPGMVTFAQFRDPAGNIVGIVDNTMPEA
ncbi:MAG: VOC family protein [Dehalococcoidia bacterium]